MKHLSKIVAFALILFVGCAFIIPEAIGTIDSHATTKMQISKKKATITKGKTIKLKIKNAKGKKIRWSSSKKKIATVRKGKVTAKKAGQTTITAKVGKKKFRCKVTVKSPVNYKRKIVGGTWSGKWAQGHGEFQFTKSGIFYFSYHSRYSTNSTQGKYWITKNKLELDTGEVYTIKSVRNNVLTLKTYFGTFKLNRGSV